MKMIKGGFVAILLLMLLSEQTLFAFGENGHRIVAEVAQRHLTPQAQHAVKKILNGETLGRIATWPDYIRSEPEWDFAKPWHFITVDVHTTVDAVLAESNENPKIDNVVEAIEYFSALLQEVDPKGEEFMQLLETQHKAQAKDGKEDVKTLKLYQDSIVATALSFLVHFVGDVHQPLHVGRAEDRGGNSIRVLWFSEDSNLHTVWDTGLIENEGLSYTEIVQFLDQDAADLETLKIDVPLEEWARESVVLRHQAYQGIYKKIDYISGKPDLSYAYAHDFTPVIQKRMLQGGLRLARLLNRIFERN